MSYSIRRIPKRNGKFRTIYIPHGELKQQLTFMVPALTRAAIAMDSYKVMHGFMPHRSPVTNAMVHRGWRYSLSFDLESFFDTVTMSHISDYFGMMRRIGVLVDDDEDDENAEPYVFHEVPQHLIDASGIPWGASSSPLSFAFVNGAARQGFPTSPALGNIAAAPVDWEICRMRTSGRFKNFVYSRYADDLTFSFDYRAIGDMLLAEVPEIIKRNNFVLNESKTKWQSADNGRRMITGVAVDGSIHVPRSMKRKLRAARHQSRHGITGRNLRKLIAKQKLQARKGMQLSMFALQAMSRRGIEEWCKLKPPHTVSGHAHTSDNQPQFAWAHSSGEQTNQPQPYQRRILR